MKRIIFLMISALILMGCDQQEFEGYDTPFVRIATSTGASSTVVLSDVNNINTYLVSLSSRTMTEELVVNYEIIVGEGLQAGRDYELLTEGTTLTFAPGVYDMPIRVKWLANAVDETKDNTIRIRLLSTNRNVHVGLPGPDGLQKELVIEKKN